MRISKRIENILGGEADGWGVFYKARAMKAAGEDVLELTIGEHDRKTDPAILRAMHESALSGNTGYAEVPGSAALRKAIARRVTARTGVQTESDNVIVTTGGQAGLFASHMAVCDTGDVALYLDPYYTTYPGTIRAAGANATPVPTRAENGFQPTKDDLESAPTGARSLLINSPNNPTGVVYAPDTLAMIADFVTTRDMWLISDEVYDTQIWQGQHLSPRALPGMAARTLVIGSMSKSHAMTGSRIGWIIAPRDIVTHLINLSTCTTYGVPGFIQDAALFALNAGDTLERDVSEVFARRRRLGQKILAGANALSLVPSSGAMYLMLDIRATGLSGEDFAYRLLEAERIAVMPGESFGHAAAGHVRVAMTVEDRRFADALKRLADFAAGLAG